MWILNYKRKQEKLLKNNGKKLIGYGSPAKATTALNFFGISNEIESIIEDNKLNHGKFKKEIYLQKSN